MSENIEKKWQKKWADAKLFESDPDEREKLFITVAFPYPSGAMHIGHGRTYTLLSELRTGFKGKTHGHLICITGFTEFQRKPCRNLKTRNTS